MGEKMVKRVDMSINEHFEGLIKGFRNLEDDFLRFIFLLDKRIFSEDEGKKEIQQKIRKIISSKNKNREEILKLLVKFLSLSKKEKEIIFSEYNDKEKISIILNKRFDIEYENLPLIESWTPLRTEAEGFDFSKEGIDYISFSEDGNVIKYFVYIIASKNKPVNIKNQIPVYGNIYSYYLVKHDKSKRLIELRGKGYKYHNFI